MSRSKFNVDKNTEKRSYNGIVFDSEMEMKYYRDVLCPLVESGTVVKCERQKPYTLQPPFAYDDSKGSHYVNSISYVADFYIVYEDGREVVIDIKGYPDAVAKLKRKMFWYIYPNVEYRWVTYAKKFGGWIDYDEYKKLRKKKKN